MLRVLTGAIETVLLVLAGYNLVVALFGWRDSTAVPVSGRTQRFRVVVPAHDEERVIGALLSDLLAQDYPAALVRTVVAADRCTDGTVEVAGRAGATLVERTEGPDGKGALLAWYLHRHPLDADEALVVLDADNRVPSDLLGRFADEITAGRRILQAYLDVANPDASVVATASALSYWASNRMVQQARRNLGWPADLGGTGMCFAPGVLDEVGGFGDALTEDQELGVRLFLAGIPVVWLHDLRIRDEKPAGAAVAVRQRSRWASGRRSVSKKYTGALLRRGTPAGWDLALRLVQPSRMGVALASLGMAGLAALGVPLLGWGFWLGAAAIQVLAPIPFLIKDGVPGRYLWKYPALVVLPLLKVPARLRRQEGWYHTPHG